MVIITSDMQVEKTSPSPFKPCYVQRGVDVHDSVIANLSNVLTKNNIYSTSFTNSDFPHLMQRLPYDHERNVKFFSQKEVPSMTRHSHLSACLLVLLPRNKTRRRER